MKLKLLIIFMLASIGVSAQYSNFGTGQLQRQIVAGDTTYRWVGSSVGNYLYGKSLSWYKSNFASLSTLQYVTPEMYGAIGDGVANDNTSVQDAINSGKPVFFSKTYLVTTLTSVANMVLFGDGKGIIKTASNSPIFTISVANVSISGLNFRGSGRTSGLLSQIAIKSIAGAKKLSITNSRVAQIGGVAIDISHTNDDFTRTAGALVSNVFIDSCNYGIKTYSRGEYNTFSNIKTRYAKVGISNKAGNNNWVGGYTIDCDTNVFIGTGSNDGHSVISGMAINHGVNFNILTDSVTNGYLFADCMIQPGSISIRNSVGIKFDNCEFQIIDPETFTVINSTKTQINNSKFRQGGLVTVTGTAPTYFNNTYDNYAVTDVNFNSLQGPLEVLPNSSGQSTFKLTNGSGNKWWLNNVNADGTLRFQYNGATKFAMWLNGSLSVGGLTSGIRGSIEIAANTANKAGLYFAPGSSLVTTQQAGQMEYNSADLYFNRTGLKRELFVFTDSIGGTANKIPYFSSKNDLRDSPLSVNVATGVVTTTSAGGYAISGQPSTSFLKANGTVDATVYATSASLSGYVPYTGATSPLNMGVFSVTAASVTGQTNSGPAINGQATGSNIAVNGNNSSTGTGVSATAVTGKGLDVANASNTNPAMSVSNAGTGQLATFSLGATLKASIENDGTIVAPLLGFTKTLIGSGTGVATTISIPHGLTGVTGSSAVIVMANNAASAGISYATVDATNVNIVFTVAPANGTNNLLFSCTIK